MITKFVHASDLHLGSKLCLPEPYEGAPVGQIARVAEVAVHEALERLVELCIAERARALVIAGDLFDGSHRLYATGLRFVEALLRLERAGVRTVWVRGNHDAASRVLKNLLLPASAVELGLGGAETLRLEDAGLAFHGVSYPERNVFGSLLPLYPPPVRGLVNVGLLHTSAEGRPNHDPYAPCTVRQLARHGYDYWALGHVHTHEVACREPYVVFSGNLQGRGFRECGPKGATLVSVEEGRIVAVEPQSLEAVRYEICRVDIGGAACFAEIVERALGAIERAAHAAGRPLLARVVLEGTEELGLVFAEDPRRRLHAFRRCAARAASSTGAAIWLEAVWAHLSEPPFGEWNLQAALAA